MAAASHSYAYHTDIRAGNLTESVVSKRSPTLHDDGYTYTEPVVIINKIPRLKDANFMLPTTSTTFKPATPSYAPINTTPRSLPVLSDRYGQFGGRFAPESIMCFLHHLHQSFNTVTSNPLFWDAFETFQRQTPLHRSTKLTALAGGATIWLKREDQNPFGSHKARNIIGQLLLARWIGRSEVVTDCASANHGVFIAEMCFHLKLGCVIVMGADDADSQKDEVLEMERLNARIVTTRTPSGMGTLRAAMAEAFRYLVGNHETTFYLAGGPIGPSPLPTMNATFQAFLGKEVEAQICNAAGRLPDAVIAPVGTGSGAVGLFRPFLRHPDIRLIGVQAAKAATLAHGEVGVLYGARTLLLQDTDGQVLDSHSHAPDLNISMVSPEVAYWRTNLQMEVMTATDDEALNGLEILREHEGISPGLDSCHAVGKTIQLARELGRGKNIILLVTGRGTNGHSVS